MNPAMAGDRSPVIVTDGRFSGFDARQHIQVHHPHLSPAAEAISHWAAYYLINPILLTRVVKARNNGVVPGSDAIRRTARVLSGFDSAGTSSIESDSEVSNALVGQLARRSGLTEKSMTNLLEHVARETEAAGLSSPLATGSTPPALDLPFARPQAWQFNGVHTWTGFDDGSPMSSIDFTRNWGLRWGDNTANDWITAAHDGEVTVYSGCFVQVQHDSGWGTRYYHLDNLQVINGRTVRAGEPLGVYASSKDQALCSGGDSTGPHLHFALLKDGSYFSLQDIELSGYSVHPGNSSYDQARDRMWLEKRDNRYYAFNQAIRIEEGDNTIDYRYNGMWYSPQSNGHGLNVEITEFPGEESSRKSVFIVIYTYDDNGLANFYVGNVDYARWRSDESMLIDMLQTSGGDFANLAAIDFNDPDQVKVAGTARVEFIDCNRAILAFDLDERSSAQPTQHAVELFKLIGVPEHVCQAASIPLPLE